MHNNSEPVPIYAYAISECDVIMLLFAIGGNGKI